MDSKDFPYHALISSDWNECLAPCGPFDVIQYHYPDLAPAVDPIFKQYTSNRISLRDAVAQVQTLLPTPVTLGQMDAYLDARFITYNGLAEFIGDCLDMGILFMINTTGAVGYFQRVLAKRLLPEFPILSAHPWIRFDSQSQDNLQIFDLFETSDKAVHTATVAAQFNIPCHRIILLGDSGGDGPHFAWGGRAGTRLIGCMTKPSLIDYCRGKDIHMDAHFGPIYSPGDKRALEKEMAFDYKELLPVIRRFLS